jgi:hypothetical protein
MIELSGCGMGGVMRHYPDAHSAKSGHSGLSGDAYFAIIFREEIAGDLTMTGSDNDDGFLGSLLQ